MSAEVTWALPQVALLAHTLAYCQAIYRLSQVVGSSPLPEGQFGAMLASRLGFGLRSRLGLMGCLVCGTI